MNDNSANGDSAHKHSRFRNRESFPLDEETRAHIGEDCDDDVTDLQPAAIELEPDFPVKFDQIENLLPGKPPFQQFGQYELRKRIGRGGMGEVYEAYDSVMKRSVALKLMRTDREDEISSVDRERFTREATTAGSLGHDNIVTVHSVGEHNGCRVHPIIGGV